MIYALQHSGTGRSSVDFRALLAVMILCALSAFLYMSSDILPFAGDLSRLVGLQSSFPATLLLGSGVLCFLFLRELQTSRRLKREKREILDRLEHKLVAIESSADGIGITDPKGVFTYANKTLAHAYGFESPEDLIGRSWRCLYGPKEQAWIKDTVLPKLNKESVWKGRTLGLREDGSSFGQDLSITQFQDGRLICVIRDATERMEAEALAKRQLAAMEASADGIGIVDEEGKILYMNHALLSLHGIADQDAERQHGKIWTSLYPVEEARALSKKVLPVIRNTGFWRGESAVVRPDGERVSVELSLTSLPDGGMVGTVRDVSDRKQAEREKEDLKAQFYQAQKMEAIGRLTGGVAHDFNNVLAAILGYTEFLIEDLEEGSDHRTFAENIRQAGVQGRSLVDQLLAFSRRKELSKGSVDLTQSIYEAVSMLRAGSVKTIEIKTDLNTPSCYVKADSTQLTQIIMNLCVNAIDAMENTHGTLDIGLDLFRFGETVRRTRPEIESMTTETTPYYETPPLIRIDQPSPKRTRLQMGNISRSNTYAHLVVEDTGSGISRAVVEHIFEPFFTTKAIDKGTGLGMATVHGILTSCQGALILDTTEGKGTRFEIFLPQAVEPDIAFADDSEKKDVEESSQDKPRVLLVDDQEQMRDMLARMLLRLGYETDVCDSPLSALDHLRSYPDRYGLVLSDHSMPDMTGLEFADELALDLPEIPVVLMSGYSKTFLEGKEKEHPSIRAVLKKPIDSKTLGHEIAAVLSPK